MKLLTGLNEETPNKKENNDIIPQFKNTKFYFDTGRISLDEVGLDVVKKA